jgi:hypothetical protein
MLQLKKFLCLSLIIISVIIVSNNCGKKEPGISFLDGWYEQEQKGDARWMSKNSRATMKTGNEGKLSFNVWLPPDVLINVYNGSLAMIVNIDGEAVFNQQFHKGIFDKGPVEINLKVPPNKTLSLEIKLDKSYTPILLNINNDTRTLGIIASNFSVR